MKAMGRKSSLFSVFFTFGLDNLGATIIFPIFAPLFFNPEESILPEGLPTHLRAILFGLFLGAFPLMQFLFSPVVGDLADRFGRKKGLITTTILAILGYFFCAIGISKQVMSLLFVGRLIMGLSAANLSICLAAISDLSQSSKEKVAFFSYGSVIGGFTFVLGPFLGGRLSDPSISTLFDPAFPMWVGLGLAFLNLLFLFFAFKETLKEKIPVHLGFFQGINNIRSAFKIEKLGHYYTIFFLFLFAFNMIFQFVPALLVRDFDASNSRIGDIIALMGICWIIGTAAIYKILSFLFIDKGILIGSLLLFGALIAFIPFTRTMGLLIIKLGACVAFAGVIWLVCTGYISSSAEKNFQGKILGVSQSMQSLAMMLAPFTGGLFLQAHAGFPFYLATVSVIIAIIFSFPIKKTFH